MKKITQLKRKHSILTLKNPTKRNRWRKAMKNVYSTKKLRDLTKCSSIVKMLRFKSKDSN